MYKKKHFSKHETTHLKLFKKIEPISSFQSDENTNLINKDLLEIIEMHRNLAKEAKRSGDRVLAEHHYQHVYHYTCLLPQGGKDLEPSL